jgi:hypothetical protein
MDLGYRRCLRFAVCRAVMVLERMSTLKAGLSLQHQDNELVCRVWKERNMCLLH